MSRSTGSPDRFRSKIDAGRVRRLGDGFTLLEVLVAFAVLAVSLGVLFQIFSTGTRASRAAEAYVYATLLAESKLAAVGIELPFQEGEQAGEFDNGYTWRVAMVPYHHGGDEIDGSSSVLAYEVGVTVLWEAAGGRQSVSLTTLRLGSRPATEDEPVPIR